MIEKHFILATAGHVDHGKSTLVKALTGTDPDRLPEEKARGITIDLGFAELNLSGPDGERFIIGIVDVPGHEDFVRNMIAGVGSIDLALLVIAADDGWMPQTEEHLQILQYLDIKRIIVALTKADLGKIETVTSQIRNELKDTTFADCPIVPTSARTGAGIEELKKAISAEFAALQPPVDIGKPRLFVDRAFTLRGIGTVVTGTLADGTVRTGQGMFVQPRSLSARIRSLQSHNRSVELAAPGTRTAMNLPDLKAGDDVKRGDVINDQAAGPGSTLDVVLTRSKRSQRAAPIKSGTSAYVHHGTTRVAAKIILAEKSSLAPGEDAVARLRLNAPLLAFVGDRVIIRDASEQQTIAGGIIFNNDSQDFGSKEERNLLATRAVAPDDVALAVWTEIARTGLIDPSNMLESARFSADQIAAALKRLAEHGEIFLRENIGVKMLIWLGWHKRAAEMIDSAHKAHPERRGIELNELRTSMSSLSPNVFDALIEDMCRGNFLRVGSAIAKRSHRPTLPPELHAPAEKLRAALAAKPFDPPNRKDLPADDLHRQALRFLIEQGDVVEISEDLALLRESYDQMQTAISDFISANGPATASQLREKLGTSRRVVIPFLEYLDRKGVTQRVGDQRVLAQKRAVDKLDDAETAERS